MVVSFIVQDAERKVCVPWCKSGQFESSEGCRRYWPPTWLAIRALWGIRRYRGGSPTDNQAFLAGRERVYEGMRLAGVPEG
jgi:hypothetical protein